MGSGGWVVLDTWLSDAKKTSNVPLMIELLQVGMLQFSVVCVGIFLNLIADLSYSYDC